MLKKLSVVSLSFVILNLFFSTSAFSQQTQTEKDAQRERDVQIFVNKHGTGNSLPVKVKLKSDNKTIKGYISEIKDDDFDIIDRKTNTTTTIEYANVKNIKKDTNRQLLVIAGVAAGLLITLVVICGTGRCEN